LVNAIFRGDPRAIFNLNNVFFDVDSWIETTDYLAGTGGVVILDEKEKVKPEIAQK
jgi:hypothetical protein